MKLCEFVNVKQTKIRLTEDLISFGGKIYPKFGQAVILAGGAGCHAKGEKILKYDLTEVNAEDVKVGDILMGDDNTPRTVLKLHRGRDTMVKLHILENLPQFLTQAIFSPPNSKMVQL
jgi:hypothetical protein